MLFVAVFSYFSLWRPYLDGPAPINPETISGTFDPTARTGDFHGLSMAVPGPGLDLASNVLGSESDQKHIEVDLTNQRLYAFEGTRKVYDFLISSGKWYPTPTGTFRIWGKFRYTKMSGGNPALNTYYYLPNVPYVMFFANDQVAASRGFSLHGTYWHNNFGHPMSHGCVNMRTEDAAVLYRWTSPNTGGVTTIRATKDDPGTMIVIYGTAPKS